MGGVSSGLVAGRLPRAGLGSWPDWLLGRIRSTPGPSWLAYLVIFAALALLGQSARWLGGGVRPGTLDPLAGLEASYPVVLFATMEALNAVALRSLQALRSALTVGDAQVGDVALDLVRTPRGWALAGAAAGFAFTAVSIVSGPAGYGLGEGVGPIMWLWEFVSGSITSTIAFAVVAHAVHQVRVVARVHRELVRVDLFRLDPLYAFANLTSWTGISLVAFAVYSVGSLTLVGGVQLSAIDFAIFGVLVLIAIAVFVVPLLGLHGRIQAEKERRRVEAGDALEATVAEVHARIRSGDFERMDKLNDALAAATSVVVTISKISTWPWRPETLRGFVSAVGLPVLIWTITAVLARLI